jgi:hypothetical protein
MKKHTFVIRVIKSDNGLLQGQLIDPISQQQLIFADAASLWMALHQILAPTPTQKPLRLSADDPLSASRR